MNENSHLLRELFEHIAIGLVICDVNGLFINVNEPFCKLIGYSKDELLQMSFFEITHPDDLANDTAQFQNSIEGTNKSFSIEKRYIKKDKSVIWVHLTVSIVRNKKNAPNLFFGTIEDISKRKETEMELLESENRYKLLLDTSPVGIAVHSEGKTVFVNNTAAEMFGATTPEELIGMSINQIIHPSTLPTSIERIKRMMTGEQGLYPAQDKYVTKDGTVLDVQVYATPIVYNGKHSAQVIIMDVTEQKKAKDSILEWERRFFTIMNSVNLVSLTLDREANITFCNTYLLELTHYTLEEVIGKNWFELFIPEESLIQANQVFYEAINFEKLSAQVENTILAKDGSRIIISWSNTILKDEKGNIIGSASIGENITQRKAYEEDLKKTQLLLTETGTVAKIGGWEFNPKTNRGSWTTEVAKIHELPAETDINRIRDMNIYQGDSIFKIEKAFRNAIKYAEPFEEDLELITRNGTHKWVRAIGNVETQNELVTRVYGSLQDVSDRVLAKKELVLAKEKAEESDRLKTAFLQNMSHEIRTPLNAIMGFSDLLSTTFDDKEILESYTEIIKHRGNDLLEIINDILDIAKIESGQVVEYSDEYNLGELFSELKTFFEEYRIRVNKQDIEFIMNYSDALKAKNIIIDSGKLFQIIINLVTNAFKFTPSGKVEFGCSETADKILSFYVSDTGIGIPKEKQDVIFERFMQVNHESSRLYSGTGLGLSIVKGLLDMLGGSIWLDSEPGKGSTFYFTFPYKSTIIETNDVKLNTMISSENSMILIVEDDFFNATYLKEVLSKTNYRVIEADNGERAVEIATTEHVDLILMDVRLPGMNGLDATRMIKKQKPGIKIIAQTAYAASSDSDKAYAAGCDGYISKPISRSKLLEMMEQLLQE